MAWRTSIVGPALALAALAACRARRAPVPASDDANVARPAARPDATPVAAADGAALMARHECQRCHDGTGLAEAPLEKHCVACHRQILASGDPLARPADVARWQRRIASLVRVPSLAAIDRRLRRGWVKDLLLRPVDVRPALPATMPRLPLTDAEAAAIAEHLVPAEARAVTFDPADVPRGAELYARLGCAACHAFTGAGVAAPASTPRPPDVVALAPDLALTRDRFQSGALVPFLLDPPAFASSMPSFGLAQADARALAAFVVLAPLTAPPPPPPFTRLPVLARPVRFAEVEVRVFRAVCWHCHSSPAYALGDGGAGNTGGFGYRPRGLDLSTATGVLSGALGDDGRRRSVIAPLADGTPRLVAHLLARHRELAGELVPGVTGMPLGLPPLPAEDIQLVESWIAQGRPL